MAAFAAQFVAREDAAARAGIQHTPIKVQSESVSPSKPTPPAPTPETPAATLPPKVDTPQPTRPESVGPTPSSTSSNVRPFSSPVAVNYDQVYQQDPKVRHCHKK